MKPPAPKRPRVLPQFNMSKQDRMAQKAVTVSSTADSSAAASSSSHTASSSASAVDLTEAGQAAAARPARSTCTASPIPRPNGQAEPQMELLRKCVRDGRDRQAARTTLSAQHTACEIGDDGDSNDSDGMSGSTRGKHPRPRGAAPKDASGKRKLWDDVKGAWAVDGGSGPAASSRGTASASVAVGLVTQPACVPARPLSAAALRLLARQTLERFGLDGPSPCANARSNPTPNCGSTPHPEPPNAASAPEPLLPSPQPGRLDPSPASPIGPPVPAVHRMSRLDELFGE